MRLINLICFSVILLLFSSVFSGMLTQLAKADSELEVIRRKTDSLIFISESFFNSCKGKGFSSLDEWEKACAALWKLESIEWKALEEKGEIIYMGKWNGPYGSGEVYGK